jgi:hypothetical protein
MIKRLAVMLACVIVLAGSSDVAWADCNLQLGGSRPNGAIIKNADNNVLQYCDDTTWRLLTFGAGAPSCTNDSTATCTLDATRATSDGQFTAANIANGVNILGVTGTLSAGDGCTAPASCPDVGDVCSDGSLFAGFVLYNNSSCEALYVTDDNQSDNIQWKNATGSNDISTDDHVDGKVNAANRGGAISNFPAFDLCESNTYHGKSDWYLPARAELNLLWLNRAAIDANAAGNFTTFPYWASTEYDNSNAWYQFFSNGDQNDTTKTNTTDVRCVRRD